LFPFLAVGPLLVHAKRPAREEAREACESTNLTLKLGMMRGYGPIDGYSRNSGCGYKCGRKTFRWDNGPQGFGDDVKPGTTTQWPAALTVSAAFDTSLAYEWGVAMGEEFWGKGTEMLEGPGVNIARVMKNGRNWEYMSGEDPVLGSAVLPRVIDGIQENVMAIAKHYILNNQEEHRQDVNAVVDEVTFMELYGPPFEAAAKNAAGFMCAYNLVNGVYACESEQTLKTVLKGYYNLTGFVVSDWGATHSTGFAINSGLDIEMPQAQHFTEDKIRRLLDSGNISMARIDDACVRILSGYYALPEAKRRPCGGGICIDANVSTPEHKALARRLSAMSTVLLKNEGDLLPLRRSEPLRIALIGPDARAPYSGGGGGGAVVTDAVVSPLEAFREAGLDVVYEEGRTGESAAAVARAVDVAVVFGSAPATEGRDRANLNLTGNIEEIIPAVAAVQKRTVVVLSVPGSILTDWRGQVPAILTNFLPGEQVGPALVDVLFGTVPPQAKLPVTFPKAENDQGMTEEQYPGVKTDRFVLQANYSEGLLVGYRWYDKHAVEPAFPFGHGLTYGKFEYSNLAVVGRKISFAVKRIAGVGCDTPQLYFAFPGADADARKPKKVLRFFQKVCYAEATVSYEYADRDVSNWDVNRKAWIVSPGRYGIVVGSSSQDIRLTGWFEVPSLLVI